MSCLNKASGEKQQGSSRKAVPEPHVATPEKSFPNAAEPLSVTAQPETQITGLTGYRAIECTLKANLFLTGGTH